MYIGVEDKTNLNNTSILDIGMFSDNLKLGSLKKQGNRANSSVDGNKSEISSIKAGGKIVVK